MGDSSAGVRTLACPGFHAAPRMEKVRRQQVGLRNHWLDLEASYNDGMVPTASQPWGELVAAVDADHLDVNGHFTGPESDPSHYDWIRTGTGYRRPAFETTWSAVFYFLFRGRP